MQEKKKGNIASRVHELVKETVEECGCILWDVEFVKEGSDHNLIIYIDKPEGISLDDCEMVNDAVEPILDEADPIDGSYFLEISSPGLERELKTVQHIKAFLGERVLVKLYAAKDGKKAYDGKITAFDEEKNEITLATDAETVILTLKECASIKTVCEF
ncbi:MAG: ribosome maturation factor RimP [Clostridia bacterium]|nr:ribosome maturation factor RimP [Clostridia bacterium]